MGFITSKAATIKFDFLTKYLSDNNINWLTIPMVRIYHDINIQIFPDNTEIYVIYALVSNPIRKLLSEKHWFQHGLVFTSFIYECYDQPDFTITLP